MGIAVPVYNPAPGSAVGIQAGTKTPGGGRGHAKRNNNVIVRRPAVEGGAGGGGVRLAQACN